MGEGAILVEPSNGVDHLSLVVACTLRHREDIVVAVACRGTIHGCGERQSSYHGRNLRGDLERRQIYIGKGGLLVYGLEEAPLCGLTGYLAHSDVSHSLFGDSTDAFAIFVVEIERTEEVVLGGVVIESNHKDRVGGVVKLAEGNIRISAETAHVGERIDIITRFRHRYLCLTRLLETAVVEGDNKVVVRGYDGVFIERNIGVEEGFLVERSSEHQLLPVAHHIHRQRLVTGCCHLLVINLKRVYLDRLLGTISAFLIDMEIQVIFLFFGCIIHLHLFKRLIVEQHVVVFSPLVNRHINGLALVAFYSRQSLTIAADSKSIVEETTGLVCCYHMGKQHHLVVIVRIEELLGYQRVELHIVNTEIAFEKIESVGELTFELALCIVNLHGNSSVIRSILQGVSSIVHRVSPYVAIGTVDGAKCL